MFLAFCMPPTMLSTTCSPSVVTQVSVSWGDPSGIRVAMKHGLGLRRGSSRPSGSDWGMTLSSTRDRVEHMFDTDEACLIDRIAVLERAKSAAAAEQAVLTA